MRKLLNTLYVTDEKAYLSLEGETIVCKSEGKDSLRIPFANLENIVCFGYLGCSPALMGKCAEEGVPLVFYRPSGKFLARVSGKAQGNVYTRVMQMNSFESNRLQLVRNTVAAKFSNTRYILNRVCRDHSEMDGIEEVSNLSSQLKSQISAVYEESDLDIIRGIEGNCAKSYFRVFSLMIRQKGVFTMNGRSKHPPLDAVNALLSFLYSLLTGEIASALESVGLDSYIGFYHTLRSGRVSLACDLIEEQRCIVERLALSMINLKMLSEKDFEKQISGAVYLNNMGRSKVLKAWQDKKRETFQHLYLKQKIPYGLLPFVQANLLAKFVRGEIGEYPPYIAR